MREEEKQEDTQKRAECILFGELNTVTASIHDRKAKTPWALESPLLNTTTMTNLNMNLETSKYGSHRRDSQRKSLKQKYIWNRVTKSQRPRVAAEGWGERGAPYNRRDLLRMWPQMPRAGWKAGSHFTIQKVLSRMSSWTSKKVSRSMAQVLHRERLPLARK